MSIELKNVTYTYSKGTAYESHALKNVNLTIPEEDKAVVLKRFSHI